VVFQKGTAYARVAVEGDAILRKGAVSNIPSRSYNPASRSSGKLPTMLAENGDQGAYTLAAFLARGFPLPGFH